MQAARALEDRLGAPQRLGQKMNHARLEDGRAARQYRTALHIDRLDRRFAAHAAARGGVEVAFQAVEIDLDSGIQFDRDGVPELTRVAIGMVRPADFANLVRVLQDAFGEQKSGGQLEVVPRGAHGNRDRFVAEADFERLFDGQQVLERRGGIALDLLDGDCQDGPVHTDFMVARGLPPRVVSGSPLKVG